MSVLSVLDQQSPTFLALGTGFMEQRFSMDLVVQVVMRAVADEALLASPPAAHLCCKVILTGQDPKQTEAQGLGTHVCIRLQFSLLHVFL